MQQVIIILEQYSMLRKRTMMSPVGDSNTITLLHFDGDATNSTDISQTWITTYDTSMTYSPTIKKFGTHSIYSENGLTGKAYGTQCYTNSGLYYNYLSSNWTAEKWIYFPSNIQDIHQYSHIFAFNAKSTTGYYSYFTLGILPNKIVLRHSTTGTYVDFDNIYSISALALQAWHHVAAVKNNNLVTIYVDGVALVSNISWSYAPNASFMYDHAIPNCMVYTDEFRFSKIARWTSNFTPPTAPYA